MKLNELSSRARFVLDEDILCIQILIIYMYLVVDIFIRCTNLYWCIYSFGQNLLWF